MNYDTQTNKTKNKEKNVMFRSFNQNRGFGIEIECSSTASRAEIAGLIKLAFSENNINSGCEVEMYGHTTRNYWKVTTDSSIHCSNGTNHTMEIVSPILYGTNGLKELKVVLDAINNKDVCTTKVNKSMGVHVHHDLTSWRNSNRSTFANNMNNLVSLIAKYEHCLFKLLPPSRQGIWCSPVREFMLNYRTNSVCAYTDRIKTLKKIHKEGHLGSFQRNPRGSGDRYCGLNFVNLFGRGSVEFRYHQGSTNYDKLSNWIVFTQAFIETAEHKKSISYTDAMTRTSVASALRRLRCDLGLTKADNDVYLQTCDEEMKRRYHLYKTNNVTNHFVTLAR